MSIEDQLETINGHLQAIAQSLDRMVPTVTATVTTNSGFVDNSFDLKESEPEKPKKKRGPKPKAKLKAKAEKNPLADLDDLGLGTETPALDSPLTIKDVRAALTALVQAKDEELGTGKGVDVAKEIMSSVGQTRLSEIPVEAFNTVIGALEAGHG